MPKPQRINTSVTSWISVFSNILGTLVQWNFMKLATPNLWPPMKMQLNFTNGQFLWAVPFAIKVCDITRVGAEASRQRHPLYLRFARFLFYQAPSSCKSGGFGIAEG